MVEVEVKEEEEGGEGKHEGQKLRENLEVVEK